MTERMECMCLECGISHYIPISDLTIENVPDFEYPLVTNISCSECGGGLFVVGKEGEQPRYLTG
ncbi:MAG TPA: hypothetical protein ENG14_05095 [Thermodesulforhabdus norvegica]|uniref:Uncharacterized protein n=1 Tax=Thermodesulforhabdus norvegica TaxID=39841 RepID=A0A7C1B105_9BACT|nr:hypothetical protein [Deltaproteobacteria bacterium]HDL90260.1 hypothetical protein [Thermodesulforhabdus norvegica]